MHREKATIIVSRYCSIDVPSPHATISASQNFTVAGWVFDKRAGEAPLDSSVQFITTDRQASKTFAIKLDVKRPDVAQVLNLPAAESSGFSLEVHGNSLVPGNYEIVVLQKYPNATMVCGDSHIYQVK